MSCKYSRVIVGGGPYLAVKSENAPSSAGPLTPVKPSVAIGFVDDAVDNSEVIKEAAGDAIGSAAAD